MKEVLVLCNRLLDDPTLSETDKIQVRLFAFFVIRTVIRDCGGNMADNFEPIFKR